MSRPTGPQPLQSVLNNVIDTLGIRRELNEARAVETWAILAGPQINGVTDSAWVRGGRLFVKIRSAAWRQELHLNRRAWRDRLNTELGAELVDEIVFR
jgi:predicted nucleic acid-binding Zn ribbon protein